MSSLPIVVSDYFEHYTVLIKSSPLLATEIENGLRWLSYLIRGRFNNSNIVSEFIYSSSTLLQLANDIILRKAYNIKANLSEAVERLRIFITIVEYTQVFFEITAKKVGGEAGRWLIIAIIQAVKAAVRLILLFVYGEGIQRQVAYSPVDRLRELAQRGHNPSANQNIVATKRDSETNELTTDGTIKLRRSGRLIRSLNHAPPRSKRIWNLSDDDNLLKKILERQDKYATPTQLNDVQKLGELIHILRPLVHLSAMSKFGQKAWTPYIVSLGMDVTSLHLLKEPSNYLLNTSERLEIGQRTISLFLYLMRSPFYDNYTKMKVLKALQTFSEKVPLLGLLARPFISYIPQWQETYFYAWNS